MRGSATPTCLCLFPSEVRWLLVQQQANVVGCSWFQAYCWWPTDSAVIDCRFWAAKSGAHDDKMQRLATDEQERQNSSSQE